MGWSDINTGKVMEGLQKPTWETTIDCAECRSQIETEAIVKAKGNIWGSINKNGILDDMRKQIEVEIRQSTFNEIVGQLGWLSGKSLRDPDTIFTLSRRQLDEFKKKWGIK